LFGQNPKKKYSDMRVAYMSVYMRDMCVYGARLLYICVCVRVYIVMCASMCASKNTLNT